jgi:hypothetical protein
MLRTAPGGHGAMAGGIKKKVESTQKNSPAPISFTR